uniref:Multiple epidermal growth factor-like domains protein 10 n=1 Tax=Crassostrea virginica TaxID=6565 RepID=A0A8B8DFR9_CRAVI|nr:multiple epidermal growth factor-like domains protein 10 [Crassostrea virginica]
MVQLLSQLFFLVSIFIGTAYEQNSPCQRTSCCEQWDEENLRCKLCSPGYIGQNCSEICPYPNYGRDCQKNCICEERLCDVSTGCVTLKGGCRSGYIGHRCLHKCKYPNYGRGCQFLCACDEKYCSFISGCNVPETTQVNPKRNANNIAENQQSVSVVGVFIGSAAFSISVSIIFTLVLLRIRKTRQSISESTCMNINKTIPAVCFGKLARSNQSCSSEVLFTTTREQMRSAPYVTTLQENTRDSTASTMVYQLDSSIYEPVNFTRTDY